MTEPKVMVFVCHWCSLGGADNAGGLKLSYSSRSRVVRVMCTGRVDPEVILRAFDAGADGVLLLGCHPGDCHYKEGNYRARNRIALLGGLLTQLGVGHARLRLDWVGAGEGARFREIVAEFQQTVDTLGALRRDDRAHREDRR